SEGIVVEAEPNVQSVLFVAIPPFRVVRTREASTEPMPHLDDFDGPSGSPGSGARQFVRGGKPGDTTSDDEYFAAFPRADLLSRRGNELPSAARRGVKGPQRSPRPSATCTPCSADPG